MARPFSITGAIAPELPINGRTKTLLFDPNTHQSHYGYLHNPHIVHRAFAIQFSTLYLTSRFTGGPPKEEPLNQLVPLNEFSVDKTIATGGRFTNAAAKGKIPLALPLIQTRDPLKVYRTPDYNREGGPDVNIKVGQAACASSEGWRVQRETVPPRQKPEAL